MAKKYCIEDIRFYAESSREFFKSHKIYRYRIKNIEKMSDQEVTQKCHLYCEKNNLVHEWQRFVEQRMFPEFPVTFFPSVSLQVIFNEHPQTQ